MSIDFSAFWSDLEAPADPPANSPIYAEVTDADKISPLDVYFDPVRVYLSPKDFVAIGRILGLNGKPQLAESPRLFWIFRKVKRLDVLANLVARGGSDYWLPLLAPKELTGAEEAAFLAAQKTIFARKSPQQYKWSEGAHNYFENEEHLPLERLRVLGRGGSGVVDEYYDRSAHRRVALKLTRRNSSGDGMRPRELLAFVQEIKLFSKIIHPHCIRFLGSYTTFDSAGILIPVADGDLYDFLRKNQTQRNAPLVQSWFGCLASAVLYLHNNHIWHADIKLKNILIYERTVLFCDFGYSIEQTSQAAQESDIQFWPRSIGYSSPEVEASHYGDGSSDIWSLGMVFMHMVKYLTGTDEYNDESQDRSAVFDRNFIPDSLSKQHALGVDKELLRLTGELLARQPGNRPTANQVVHRFRTITEKSPQWCGSCCLQNLTEDNTVRQGLEALVTKKEHFTESDVRFISHRLASEQMFEWANIPRTYIVLSLMGQVNLMSKFVKAGVSDIWFPYGKSLLRQLLQDAQMKDEFYSQQETILSKGFHDLNHHHSWSSEEYLDDIKELGSGGYGSVWHVFDPQTNRHLAKKIIPRVNVLPKNRAKVVADTFERELSILRRVTEHRHPHLVAMIASFTDLEDFGILFSPLADMNLDEYLREVGPTYDLKKWFGCLATALNFLHGMKIRHKDIKPQNILVHGSNILLTDFGISNDWSIATGPTTSGPGARDPHYCAPEVADWDKRNESADIYSLGCVFLEMYSVLEGFHISDMRGFFERIGTCATWYHKNSQALELWIFDKLLNSSRPMVTSEEPALWISRMVSWDRNIRITSSGLVEEILGIRTEGHRPVSYSNQHGIKLDNLVYGWCGECCVASYQRDRKEQYCDAAGHPYRGDKFDRTALRAAIPSTT